MLAFRTLVQLMKLYYGLSKWGSNMSTLKKTLVLATLLTVILSIGNYRAWGKDVSGIPDRDYTIWGTAYVDGVALTRSDTGYAVSLQVDGAELDSYIMGGKPINEDWYVLKIPMSIGELPGYAQPGDTAYIYTNGVLVAEAYLEPAHQSMALPITIGNPGETVRMAVYTQISPGAVGDLSASGGVDYGEIELTWTAPGNNGSQGTAAGYVVKYSQNPITNQTEFDNATTFPQSWTPKSPGQSENYTLTGLTGGQNYYFAVEAVDSVPLQAPMSNSPVSAVARDSAAPVASDLEINPDEPGTADNLVGSYTYYDEEENPESALTEIRWYRNDELQPDYNNILTLPSDATAKDQQWHFTVKPHDGYGFGALQTSAPMMVINTRPVASDPVISPALPLTGDPLIARYNYSDADDDPEADSTIRWYRNDSLRSIYNDLTTVPSSGTRKGQNWRFTVRPGDGEGQLGAFQTSPTVTIGNTPPVADAGGLYEALPGEAVAFDGSGSFDADGDALIYLWDFGDNVASNSMNPTHTYINPGTYTVVLTVNDGTEDSNASAGAAYIGTEPGAVQQIAFELGLGWNLISINVQPADTSLVQVLSNIDGKYDAVWAYDSGTVQWRSFIPDGPPEQNDLNEIRPGAGYWINMTQTGILIVQGEQPETPVILRLGWNLVGYNSQAAKPVEDSMISVQEWYDSVSTYDTFEEVWYLYVPGGPSFLSNMQFMQPGKGYWIRVAAECLWNVGP